MSITNNYISYMNIYSFILGTILLITLFYVIYQKLGFLKMKPFFYSYSFLVKYNNFMNWLSKINKKLQFCLELFVKTLKWIWETPTIFHPYANTPRLNGFDFNKKILAQVIFILFYSNIVRHITLVYSLSAIDIFTSFNFFISSGVILAVLAILHEYIIEYIKFNPKNLLSIFSLDKWLNSKFYASIKNLISWFGNKLLPRFFKEWLYGLYNSLANKSRKMFMGSPLDNEKCSHIEKKSSPSKTNALMMNKKGEGGQSSNSPDSKTPNRLSGSSSNLEESSGIKREASSSPEQEAGRNKRGRRYRVSSKSPVYPKSRSPNPYFGPNSPVPSPPKFAFKSPVNPHYNNPYLPSSSQIPSYMQSNYTNTPRQPGYSNVPGQPGYPGQPWYSNIPGQPGYTAQPSYTGQPGYTGQSTYTEQPEHPKQSTHPDQPGYVDPIYEYLGTDASMYSNPNTATVNKSASPVDKSASPADKSASSADKSASLANNNASPTNNSASSADNNTSLGGRSYTPENMRDSSPMRDNETYSEYLLRTTTLSSWEQYLKDSRAANLVVEDRSPSPVPVPIEKTPDFKDFINSKRLYITKDGVYKFNTPELELNYVRWAGFNHWGDLDNRMRDDLTMALKHDRGQQLKAGEKTAYIFPDKYPESIRHLLWDMISTDGREITDKAITRVHGAFTK